MVLGQVSQPESKICVQSVHWGRNLRTTLARKQGQQDRAEGDEL